VTDHAQPLWRQREYRLLWGGQVVTTLGAQASGIIHPLLILALTGSPARDRSVRLLRAEVAEGMRRLWSQRVVRDMALITGVLKGVNAALPLMLIVLGQQRGASEAQIGLIFSLGGVGAVFGALLGGALSRRLSFGQAILLSLGVRALCIPLLLLCPGPLSPRAVYALASLFGPLYDVVQFSDRIALIPDALQGRVNSSFRLFAFLLTPVGAAACGWLLEHGGTARAVGVFGAVCAGLALAVRLDPAIRHAVHPQVQALR